MNPLLKIWRRGETITPLDHLRTIRSAEELFGFRQQLQRDGRLTATIQAAIEKRRSELK